MVSNAEFGRRVDCSPSMASRLFAGRRRPSADLRDRIVEAYGFNQDLDTMREVVAASQSREEFGRFLRFKLDRQTEEDLVSV